MTMPKWRVVGKWVMTTEESRWRVTYSCINLQHVVSIEWWEDEEGRHAKVYTLDGDSIHYKEDEFPSKEEWLEIISQAM
jgi:DNA modification methylase